MGLDQVPHPRAGDGSGPHLKLSACGCRWVWDCLRNEWFLVAQCQGHRIARTGRDWPGEGW